MIAHMREIASYRFLLSNLVVRDLKLRYKGSILGFLWSLVNPLLLMLVFTFVFTVMLPEYRVPRFPVFVMCAVLPWNFFSTAIMGSIGAISGNGHLIKKVYFPPEILPMATVLANFVNFMLASIVLFAMIMVFRIPLTFALVWLPLIMLAHILFTGGMAFILSTINVFYRDTGVIMEVLIQAWFFLTPVFYPLEVLPEWGELWGVQIPVQRMLYILNPMASIIASYRSVLYGTSAGGAPHAPAADFFARTFLTTLLFFFVGLWFMGRFRTDFAELV